MARQTVVGTSARPAAPKGERTRPAGELLAPGPDGLLFIANSFDVAQLGQHAHGRAAGMPITATEWASCKVLAEFGSGVVEGLLIAQSCNPLDTSAPYLAFQQQFLQVRNGQFVPVQ